MSILFAAKDIQIIQDAKEMLKALWITVRFYVAHDMLCEPVDLRTRILEN